VGGARFFNKKRLGSGEETTKAEEREEGPATFQRVTRNSQTEEKDRRKKEQCPSIGPRRESVPSKEVAGKTKRNLGVGKRKDMVNHSALPYDFKVGGRGEKNGNGPTKVNKKVKCE